MGRMLKTIRNNAEEIAEIKQRTVDHKLPFGTLIGGSESVHLLVTKFHQARISDSNNEAFPKNSRRLSQKTKKMLGSERENERD